jgi:hypothetical protein
MLRLCYQAGKLRMLMKMSSYEVYDDTLSGSELLSDNGF